MLPLRQPNHSLIGLKTVEFLDSRRIVVDEIRARGCADFESDSLSQADNSLANFADGLGSPIHLTRVM